MKLLCLGLALLAAVAVTPATAQPAPERFITGAETHFSQHDTDAEGTFNLAVQAGMRSIRDDIGWAWVEQQPGQYAMLPAWDHYVEAATRAGLDPLLVLDYGNSHYDGGDKPRSDAAIAAFTRFAEFVAQHFQGKVRRYEVWNEWDNTMGNTTSGSQADYVRLLKSVYPALKHVDPAIQVLANSVIMGKGSDSDLIKMAQLDALSCADGISMHSYWLPAEGWAHAMESTEASLSRVNKGAPVPLYITEIGWATHDDKGGLTLSGQAAYAARILLLARTMPFTKGLWWYDFHNDGQNLKDHEQNYGLVWPDLTPKPAYYAVADVTATLTDATLIERRAMADGDDWLLRFRDAQGEEFWAVWSAKPGVLARFNLTIQSLFSAAGQPKPLAVHEVATAGVNRSWVAGDHGTWRLSVTAGDMPVFLRGDLSDITIAGVDHQEFPNDPPH